MFDPPLYTGRVVKETAGGCEMIAGLRTEVKEWQSGLAHIIPGTLTLIRESGFKNAKIRN
jgi:hypothetical protein